MINEFHIGDYAVSSAGHDVGKCYVINQMEHEYVYLVDGKIRTLNHPKKKKIKHVKKLDQTNQPLAEKVKNLTVKDEEIKRAIKLLRMEQSIKEAKSNRKGG